MKKKLSLYLAHQYVHRRTVRQLELELESKYNLNLDNPFYDSKRNDIQKRDAGIKCIFTKKIKRAIRESDLQMIRNNQGILCIIFDLEALGSYQEMFYCSYILKKPVFLVCALDHIRKHVWTVDYIPYKNLDGFERWLTKNGYEK